eukprot:1138778-Pelagomonas_calceolata.AAC.3
MHVHTNTSARTHARPHLQNHLAVSGGLPPSYVDTTTSTAVPGARPPPPPCCCCWCCAPVLLWLLLFLSPQSWAVLMLLEDVVGGDNRTSWSHAAMSQQHTSGRPAAAQATASCSANLHEEARLRTLKLSMRNDVRCRRNGVQHRRNGPLCRRNGKMMIHIPGTLVRMHACIMRANMSRQVPCAINIQISCAKAYPHPQNSMK